MSLVIKFSASNLRRPQIIVNQDKMSDTNPSDKPSREVRASFRKVVAFDLLFFGLGILVGLGIGVYIVPALSK